jgi:hypothetical protein
MMLDRRAQITLVVQTVIGRIVQDRSGFVWLVKLLTDAKVRKT